jgi:membrane protease YdiL (CAAX protease family)
MNMPPTEQARHVLPERIAHSLRGIGPVGIVTFVAIAAASAVFVPLAAALVLAWAWMSRTPLRNIGLVRPMSWLNTLAIGIALGIAAKFLMKALLLPLLGAPAINPIFGDLAANPGRAIFLVFYILIGAAFSEELVFRGYMFERLGGLVGTSLLAQIVVVILSTAFFGALHYQQGISGIENASIGGLIAAVVYLINRRRLWTVIVMHAAFDLSSLALIYFHLETLVAHSIFK